MSEQAYAVEVQPDYLEKITRARPAQAIAELIWNSLDADASYVSARFGHNALGRVDSIQLRDNGTGIPYDKAPELFRRLGGSWKRPGAQTEREKRFLHGQEGRGHFKAFALGTAARWEVVYQKENQLYAFDILMTSARIREVRISAEVLAPPNSHPGVVLTIENVYSEAETWSEPRRHRS